MFERALCALTLLLGAHALYIWSVGFHHSISDLYGFRQAQTALAARTILEGSPRLFYEVPIFGPPWALPEEFPLYQWLTALLTATGIPLIEAGRIISIGFFVVCLFGVWKVLGCFGVERGAKWAITSLILSCPIYLFWPHALLIETCVLALSLWYAYFALQAMMAPRRSALVAGAILGVLAAMVKVTTFLPFWVFLGVWLLAAVYRRKIDKFSAVTLGGVLIAVPIIAGYVWTELATYSNQQNSLMASFYYPAYVRHWVFGTVADRFSPELWTAVYDRILPDTIGLAMAVPILFGLLPAARRYGYHAIVSGMLFLFPIFVFPELQRYHTYYQTENALFLSAAGGFVAYGLIRRRGAVRLAGCAVLLLFVFSGLTRYYIAYFPYATKNDTNTLEAGERAKQFTKASDIIIVQGQDWSSEIPFYAHRRAIMDRSFSPELLTRQVKGALPAAVGDVLVCADARKNPEKLDLDGKLNQIQQLYGIRMEATFDDGFCIHYTRSESIPDVSPQLSLPFLAVLDFPKDGSVMRGRTSVEGWILSVPKVREVYLEIDGRELARGQVKAYRPDLTAQFPPYPGHPYNGFTLNPDATGLHTGQHSLEVKATLEDGSTHVVGSRTIVAP